MCNSYGKNNHTTDRVKKTKDILLVKQDNTALCVETPGLQSQF